MASAVTLQYVSLSFLLCALRCFQSLRQKPKPKVRPSRSTERPSSSSPLDALLDGFAEEATGAEASSLPPPVPILDVSSAEAANAAEAEALSKFESASSPRATALFANLTGDSKASGGKGKVSRDKGGRGKDIADGDCGKDGKVCFSASFVSSVCALTDVVPESSSSSLAPFEGDVCVIMSSSLQIDGKDDQSGRISLLLMT